MHESIRPIYRLFLIVVLFNLIGMHLSSAQSSAGTLLHDGLERRYELFVPSGYDPAAPVPLLVVLHPFASSSTAWRALTDFDKEAEERGWLVVYPDSTDFFWNEGVIAAGWPPNWEEVDDEGFIAALIDQLSSEYAVSEVHLAGFANGGSMAYRLACTMPERFASVVVSSALLWEYQTQDCAESTASLRLFIMIGLQDTETPFAGQTIPLPGAPEEYRQLSLNETVAFWLNRAGCVLEPTIAPEERSLLVYSDCAEEGELTVYAVRNAGKNWPRKGAQSLNQFGVDATEIAARFIVGDESWYEEVPGDPLVGLLYGGFPRSYSVYVPPAYNPENPTPLLIALHGSPDNGSGIAYRFDLNRVARENGFIVLYPDGLDNRWNYTYGISGYPPLPQDDVDFLTTLIDDLSLDFNLDRSRIYATGFSNGGYMTERLICQASDVFAAYGIVGASAFPGVLEVCEGATPRPIIMIHGTDDVSIPFNGVPGGQNGAILPLTSTLETVTVWASQNNCGSQINQETLPEKGDSPGTRVHILHFTECPPESPMIFYLIEGGGHNLPGVPGRIRPEIAGRVNMDIHAGEAIWQFFSQYTLPQEAAP